jgi:hypothetical protein
MVDDCRPWYKRRKVDWRLVTAVYLLVAAPSSAGATPLEDLWNGLPTRSADRAIIDSAAARQHDWRIIVSGQDYWTPSLPDVLALEKRLPDYLRRTLCDDPPVGPQFCGWGRFPLWMKVPTYKRQYVGVVRDGRRVIFANFFCEVFNKKWRSEPVFVLDGGDCFVQVNYDVKSGLFSDLMVNGEA